MGEQQPVNIDITNLGEEFYDVLYLFASSDSTSMGKVKSKAGITIAPNASTTLQLSFLPDTEGTWTVWISTNESESNIIGQYDVDITTNSYPLGDFMFTNIAFKNADNAQTDSDGSILQDVFSKSIAVTLQVKNHSGDNVSYDHPFNFYFILFQVQDDGNWSKKGEFYSNSLYSLFPKNTTISYPEMTFDRLDYGTYRLVLYTRDNITKELKLQDDRYTIRLVSGFPVWTAAGSRRMVKSEADVAVADEDVAVDLSNFSFDSILPNANPNTLYFLGADQEVPASLSQKNVVKGNHAENITITDGQSFFAPTDFTASHISYSRLFSEGLTASGHGWSTIVLPFAPDEVTADGEPVAMKAHADDAPEHYYWLMEYAGDDQDEVTFNYATAFEPYHPYLIAVPGNDFESNLTGKVLTFSASGYTLVEAGRKSDRYADRFKFVGTMNDEQTLLNAYLLQTDGSNFTRTATAQSQPFRAHFEHLGTAQSQLLRLSFDEPLVSCIEEVQISTLKPQTSTLYDLQGRHVSHPQKGLYIINGKKTIIR